MKSAYLVLGIPGNAELQEIEAAFERARAYYTPERLAGSEDALEKFEEVRTAYRILKDPQSRAAHDRKLLSASRPSATAAPASRPTPDASASSPSLLAKYFKASLVLLVVLFGSGMYINAKNAEARRQQALAEQAALKRQQDEEAERRRQEAQLEEERARAEARAAQEERRLALESTAIARQAAAETARAEAAAAQAQRQAEYEARRRESERLSEERRQAYEAQRRIAADKQRVRELCWQNYRRPDC